LELEFDEHKMAVLLGGKIDALTLRFDQQAITLRKLRKEIKGIRAALNNGVV